MSTTPLVNGHTVHVDDIVPLTNPSQQMDLARMLFYTPKRRKPYVALAYLDLPFVRWTAEAGFTRVTVYDWIAGRHQMPLGAALRLARVLGLSVEELFTDSV